MKQTRHLTSVHLFLPLDSSFAFFLFIFATFFISFFWSVPNRFRFWCGRSLIRSVGRSVVSDRAVLVFLIVFFVFSGCPVSIRPLIIWSSLAAYMTPRTTDRKLLVTNYVFYPPRLSRKYFYAPSLCAPRHFNALKQKPTNNKQTLLPLTTRHCIFLFLFISLEFFRVH